MDEEQDKENIERIKRSIMDNDPGKRHPILINDGVMFTGKKKDDEERERTGNKLWSLMVKIFKW